MVLNIIEVTLKRSLLTGSDLSIEPATTTDSGSSSFSHDSFSRNSRKSRELQLSMVRNPVLPPKGIEDLLASKIDGLALQISSLKAEMDTRLGALEKGASVCGGRSNSVYDEVPPPSSSPPSSSLSGKL
jgi:hypothetical protein